MDIINFMFKNRKIADRIVRFFNFNKDKEWIVNFLGFTSKEIDLNTIHGLHYTEKQFDSKVLELYKNYITKNGRLIDSIDPNLRESLLRDFRFQVYMDWNWCSIEQYALHEVINKEKYNRQLKYLVK